MAHIVINLRALPKQTRLPRRPNVLDPNTRTAAHATEDRVLLCKERLWRVELGDLSGVHHEDAVVADDGVEAVGDA